MLHAMSALRRSLALLFALAPCAAVHAQWDTGPVVAPRVEYRTFASAAAGATVSYHVWTPPNYDTEPNRRFPVLYWLHGSGAPTSSVAPMSGLFANAIAEGQMPPTIVVFPNGWDYGMWTDSKDGLRPLETVLMQELLPLVDASFRTIATREGRILEGFSMGGMGAARLGMKHPATFAAASILGAGPLQLDFMVGPSCLVVPDAQRAQIYQDVWGSDPAYYLANTPWTLAQQNASAVIASGLRVRQAVGAADCMLQNNIPFDAHLTQLGIAHSYATPAGVGHSASQLLPALGAANWNFYRETLGGTPTGSAFCLGDGGGAACPCGNFGQPGQGCANSNGAGARLDAHGNASVGDDTLRLEVQPVPNTSLLFFQGTQQVNSGLGAGFGDGLRCAGGSVVRLKSRNAALNFAAYPAGGDAPVSVQGALPLAGGTRHYQVWYRNAATFCTSATFNLSNGWSVTWTP